MGYAGYTITRNGQQIEAGYAIEAECDQPDCTERITRSLDELCGVTPGGDEFGCGAYCCDAHLYMAPEGQEGWRCQACNVRNEGAPSV